MREREKQRKSEKREEEEEGKLISRDERGRERMKEREIIKERDGEKHRTKKGK